MSLNELGLNLARKGVLTKKEEMSKSIYRSFFSVDNVFHRTLFILADSEMAWEVVEKMCVNFNRMRFFHNESRESMVCI